MVIRAVIFDMGGVIARTVDRSPRERLARRCGLTYDELSQIVFGSQTAQRATIGQATDEEHWASVCEALKIPVEELDPLKELFWGGDFIDMELVNFIRGLRPRYKTGLLSNAWPNLRKVLANHWKIIDAFDEVIISAEVKVAKPDPRIYAIAIERLQIAPAEAVFVDDVGENIIAARQAGLHAIHFLNPEQMHLELDALLGLDGREDR